jgi:hypothetical protein
MDGGDDPVTPSCLRERDVLRAVARGWVGRGDEETAAHAAACERCGAVRAAADLLRADHLHLAQAARVVPGAALWWRLERRRREEQARRAQKIAFALQGVMLAAAAGGTAAVVQLALPWMQASAGTAAEAWRTIAAILVEWSQSGVASILPLALGVAAWLLLLPAAIYLGLVDE